MEDTKPSGAERIQGCIFDLDGTLLDTLDDLADCANSALEETGFAPHPVDAYRFFVGDGMETLMRRAAPGEAGEDALKRLAACMRDTYAMGWAVKTKPYPGIPDMLEKLAAMGLRLGVLSNKPHDFTLLTVRHFFPGIPFARVQGSPQGGKAKPDPALALAMAGELGLRPGQVLFLGDSSTDMDTAMAAGMRPVGAGWGFRPEEELKKHGAKSVLARPEQIFTLL